MTSVFRNLLTSGLKAVFVVRQKQNRTLDLKIQTFSGLTTFGQDKKSNQLLVFNTKEKTLEIIDLQT